MLSGTTLYVWVESQRRQRRSIDGISLGAALAAGSGATAGTSR
jgi:hypothetical protein